MRMYVRSRLNFLFVNIPRTGRSRHEVVLGLLGMQVMGTQPLAGVVALERRAVGTQISEAGDLRGV